MKIKTFESFDPNGLSDRWKKAKDNFVTQTSSEKLDELNKIVRKYSISGIRYDHAYMDYVKVKDKLQYRKLDDEIDAKKKEIGYIPQFFENDLKKQTISGGNISKATLQVYANSLINNTFLRKKDTNELIKILSIQKEDGTGKNFNITVATFDSNKKPIGDRKTIFYKLSE